MTKATRSAGPERTVPDAGVRGCISYRRVRAACDVRVHMRVRLFVFTDSESKPNQSQTQRDTHTDTQTQYT